MSTTICDSPRAEIISELGPLLDSLGNISTSSLKQFQLRQPYWNFGIPYSDKRTDVVTQISSALADLEIEWQYIPKECKFKCRTFMPDEKQIEDGDESFVSDFLNKTYLKFYIVLYKAPPNQPSSNGRDQQMMDIYLFKGNPMVF